MFEHLNLFDPAHAEFVAAAVADERVGLALQDIRRANDPDQILYKECLARLTAPDGSIHGSHEFAECLEALGESATLDRHMLGLVLDLLETDPHAVLGTNLSAESLLDKEKSKGILDPIRTRPHLAPRLVLELAESQALQSLSFAAGVIAEIRESRCRVALEGFGTGYASPRFVQLIDFDVIKIDKAFIQDRRSSISGKDSLSHIVGFASCFAPVVVIEGVETKEQADRARIAGATHVQSSIVSLPVVDSGRAPVKAEDLA